MFPDPLASQVEKASDEYGLKYTKAIESQWGSMDNVSSTAGARLKNFERTGTTQMERDFHYVKQILNSLDPNNGDGTLLNLDWSPVPIVPKFVGGVNKVLSRSLPTVEAEPSFKGEKDEKKALIEMSIENKAMLRRRVYWLTDKLDPSELPDSEEAEIFMDQNIKTNAEIAAQVGTS